MINYLVVEISGRQHKVMPNKPVVVDYLGDIKELNCDRVLLRSEDSKLEIGTPYLKENTIFNVIEMVKLPKIRVSTFKAKANTRKVRGSKAVGSKIEFKAK